LNFSIFKKFCCPGEHRYIYIIDVNWVDTMLNWHMLNFIMQFIVKIIFLNSNQENKA